MASSTIYLPEVDGAKQNGTTTDSRAGTWRPAGGEDLSDARRQPKRAREFRDTYLHRLNLTGMQLEDEQAFVPAVKKH